MEGIKTRLKTPKGEISQREDITIETIPPQKKD